MITKYNWFNGLFLVILLVGYFFISFLPGILGAPSRVFTIPFRAVVLIMSMYIIYRGVVYRHQTFNAWQWTFFVVFWTVYTARIIYDLYFRSIESTVFLTPADYMLNALGVCLLPAVAIKYADKVNYDWVLSWVFWLLGLALLTSLFFNLVSPLTGEEQYAGRYQGSAAMNTIAYGHYGVTFSLISIFLLNRSESYYKKFFYLISFVLGLFIMYLAGSRGPLAALLVCLLFYQVNNSGLLKGVFMLALLAVPLVVFSEEIIELLSGFGGSFIERVLATVNEGHTSGRDVVYAEAWQEVINAPWLGNAFLIQTGPYAGFYPHNIIIESLMAVGALGSIFFLGWLYYSLRTSYRLIVTSHPAAWVGVLFLQYLMFGMFSSSIFLNTGFWYYSVIVWSVGYYQNKKDEDTTELPATTQHKEIAGTTVY